MDTGTEYRIFLRLLKKKVITVQLNTEHEVKYTQTRAEAMGVSASATTKIAEVENPGKPDEREKPAGTGEGFLWRLNTDWRFEERDGGTWVECQASSLTRDVPFGLGGRSSRSFRDPPEGEPGQARYAPRAPLWRSSAGQIATNAPWSGK